MSLFYRERHNPNPLASSNSLRDPRGTGGFVGANVEYPQWQRGTLGQAIDANPAMRNEQRTFGGPRGKTLSMTVAVPDRAQGAAPGLNRDYGTQGMGETVFDRMPRVKT